MALIRPIVPTWTMSSMGSLRLRNRPAANFTNAMFSSIRVFRTYWYSCVPSSSTASLPNSTLDITRASAGDVVAGSVRSRPGK